MSDDQFDELQDPDSWDNASGETRPPVRNARSVVSVSFQKSDLDRVSEYAERIGMKTSEFIRSAAIELATDTEDQSMDITSTSGAGGARILFAERTMVRPGSSYRIDQTIKSYST